jgi:hypothetical protein
MKKRLNRTIQNCNRTKGKESITILWKKAQQEVRQHWFISDYIAAYIQVLYRVTRVCRTGLTVSRGIGSSPRGSPKLWPRLEGEEVRGPTSLAVPIEGTGIAYVEAVKAPPVLGVQKPPRRVGKRFWDRLVAAPGKKMKKPVGLKTRSAWLRGGRLGADRRSAAAMQAAKLGVRSRASLEVADGNDLVPGPDSDGQGVGSAAQNGIEVLVERLKGWNDAALTDRDKGGREELGWQLARQLGARIVPRQRNSGNIQSL